MRKPDFAACEQQKCTPACATTLVAVAEQAGLNLYLLTNTEEKFSLVKAEIMLLLSDLIGGMSKCDII